MKFLIGLAAIVSITAIAFEGAVTPTARAVIFGAAFISVFVLARLGEE